MKIQEIRKYYEYPVIDCCNLHGIEYRAENALEPGGDAYHKYVTARLQFNQLSEAAVGASCGVVLNQRALFVVEYFGPKGIGPADAQNFMECVVCSFTELKGVSNISGPVFDSTERRPYFFARVSFGLQIPGNLSGTTWSGGGNNNGGDSGSGGGGGTGTVTTAEVELTHPQTFAIAGDRGEIIPDPPASDTQEDANAWIVESLDELDHHLTYIDGGTIDNP